MTFYDFCFNYPWLILLIAALLMISGWALFIYSHFLKRRKKDNDDEKDLSTDQNPQPLINSDKINDSLKRFKLNKIPVHSVMTPRTDVMTLDIADSWEELLNIVNDSRYSRFPVCDKTIDNIKGVLYLKDILPYAFDLEKRQEFQWQDLIREAYFIDERKDSASLLKDFQRIKTHIAVIMDEYGGLVGIVTLEDILEEIVGDIEDETDDDNKPLCKKIAEDTYIFDGKTLLNDFLRELSLEESILKDVRGEADTLAGLFLEQKGLIPPVGENFSVELNKKMEISFSVESRDQRRIKEIKVVFKKKDDIVGNKILSSLVLGFMLLNLTSCSDVLAPKPRSYFRIDFPEKNYTKLSVENCPYEFEMPTYSNLIQSKRNADQPFWFDICVPEHKATIYLTFRRVLGNFDAFIEDDWKMIYQKIALKADAVATSAYDDEKRNVYAMLYDISGDAASPIQFYITDSTKNFLRGSLYFNATPNYDSISPALEFFRQDIVHLIETFNWNQQNLNQ